MRPTWLAFASILVLGASAIAGDEPGRSALPPAAEQVAVDFLSRDDGVRSAAEKVISEAPPAFLRAVLAAVRTAIVRPPGLPAPDPMAAKRTVHLEVRFLDMTEDMLRDLGAPFGTPGFAAGRPWIEAPGCAFLDEVQVEMLLRVAAKDMGLTVLTRTSSSVHDGQAGTTEMLHTTQYVDDYTVEAGIAKPVVKRVVDGFVVDARPTVSANGKSIRLDLTTRVRRITKPIEEQDIRLPGVESPVRVQRPELRTEEWSKTLTVPDGGSVMLGGWTSDDPERKGKVTLGLVTTKVLDLPAPAVEPEKPPKAPALR